MASVLEWVNRRRAKLGLDLIGLPGTMLLAKLPAEKAKKQSDAMKFERALSVSLPERGED